MGTARQEAMLSLGKQFVPLMVLAPRNFEGWLVSMDNQVVPTKGLFRFVFPVPRGANIYQ